MDSFFSDFIRRIGLTDAEVAHFSEVYARMTGEFSARFDEARRRYREDDYDLSSTLALREELAHAAEVTPEALSLVVVAAESEYLLPKYRAAGYSDTLFYETMEDLTYKVRECERVKGHPGIFVEPWYRDFLRMRTFRLGRLEFQKEVYRSSVPYTLHGASYKAGDPIIQLHIPENGPLTRERRFESYKRAYEFFPEYRTGDVLFAVCHSWLLYPENRKIFTFPSNVVDFMGDFDIFDAEESPAYGDAWRLYGRFYDGHPENLPRETKMQRAMADWLISGKHSGVAWGMVAITKDGLLSGIR